MKPEAQGSANLGSAATTSIQSATAGRLGAVAVSVSDPGGATEPGVATTAVDGESTPCIEETTTPEQALLYRLSGDLNPLHADPDFAAKVGFNQGPLLHGLCTYGYMVRHVAKGACGGDATKVTGFEAKFSKPVWPGDTLVTEGWNVAPGKVALQVSVKERSEAVITGAWATIA